MEDDEQLYDGLTADEWVEIAEILFDEEDWDKISQSFFIKCLNLFDKFFYLV